MVSSFHDAVEERELYFAELHWSMTMKRAFQEGKGGSRTRVIVGIVDCLVLG